MPEEGEVTLIYLRPDPVDEGPDTLRCPACGTDNALSIVGSQAASLRDRTEGCHFATIVQ